MQEDKFVLAGLLNETSETPFGSIAMQSPGISILINIVNRRILFFDERFTEKFGYTSYDINSEGFSLGSLIDDIQLERLSIQVNELYAGKTNRFTAYHFKKKNGDFAICYVYTYLVNKPGVTRDIIQLYIQPEFSEQDLPFMSYDTRELFLKQFNNINFGTFEWVIKSNRVFWSDGIYKIYEIDDRDKNFDHAFVKQFTHPDDAERAADVINKAIQQCIAYDIELRIITAKQNHKTIQTSGDVVLDIHGVPVKLVGSIRDVTGERVIEENLKRKVAELNKSNMELEEFAYVASHDLQEPLRKISTFCDRLSEKYTPLLSGDGAMYMERIMASADNMRMLIHNLLEFSRVTKAQVPFMTVNLNFILQEVKNELELLIEETGTVINIQPLPHIQAAVILMNQLFANLINNAIKFRKPGAHATINIFSLIATNAQKEKLFLPLNVIYHDIVVEDDGIGFGNEYADKIFQIFQRLHGKADYPGSGIGLAICKKIAEKHNGGIYAESNEGTGTRFHIILPVKTEQV